MTNAKPSETTKQRTDSRRLKKAHRLNMRFEATLHAQPDYRDRLDALLFPCGADATRAGGRVAWEHGSINCAGCLAELQRRSDAQRVAVRANDIWLAMAFEERVAFAGSREDWHSELYRRARLSLGLEVMP